MKALKKFFVLVSLLLSIPVFAAPEFMDFPVTGYGPYSPGIISSVVDHDVPHDLTQATLPFRKSSSLGPFGYNGSVLSFTGELFSATSSYPKASLGCYPKSITSIQTNGVWSSVLKNVYSGSSAGNCFVNKALNYDNHPGTDYVLSGRNVYPVAAGTVAATKCIKTFADYSSCDSYGAVAIMHSNGFVTQYLHMSGTSDLVPGQPVTRSTVLGIVSSVGTASPHLHFEVLMKKLSL